MESSLLDRLACAHNIPPTSFIPLNDDTVFVSLLRECLHRVIAGVQSAKAIALVDAASMQEIREAGFEIGPALSIVEIAPPDSRIPGRADLISPLDRIFLCVSPVVTVTLVGTPLESESRFAGGWSLKQSNADALLAMLCDSGCVGEDVRTDIRDIPEPPAGDTSAFALDLMAAHARAQAVQQETIAKDKADLFSVLTILKAISSKRRAHDILFVFVEHISKVVQSDRCSIVRVWGGDPMGHVMASHEDASVVNRTIELHKYPELRHSMDTQQKILINDALEADDNEPFVAELKKAGINSLIVIPIVLFDQHVGSLLLRAARMQENFTPREVSFFEIVAEAASNALERAQLFESIQIANERLERLAITDGLTGLYNHRHFREHLQKEFDRASRYKLPLSCMIFDVDDFKVFNDTYGHLVGDMVLKEIAARTMKCIRKSDLIARYGGEEFVLIMPQTGREGAQVEAERIRAVVADTPFNDMRGEAHVTISGGVAVLEHDSMLDAEDLLRAADQALYEAKRNGKNRVVLAPRKGSQ